MNQVSYLRAFSEIQKQKLKITKAKNADYASPEDAFQNLGLIEKLTDGKTSTEQGLIVRMTDKLQRITNLLSREAEVEDETIADTLLDLSNYADILNIYLKHKGNKRLNSET